ncbi:MAG: hypothetical protein ACYDA9_08175 [Terriglobia bacterium]
MNLLRPDYSRGFHSFACLTFALIFLSGCEPTIQRPAGPAGEYSDATDLFEKGKFGQAIQFSEGLANDSPSTPYTDRARVLRIVIFSGQIKAYKDLADAYSSGWEKTKDPQFRSEFGAQRQNNLQYGVEAALNLDQVAGQLTKGGTLPKDLTLEAPYPAAEGPTVVAQLNRVRDGGGIPSGEQDAAAIDAQRKGIDDTLGEIVGGDRATARSVLKAGPVKLDSFKFAIFLTKQLENGAGMFDKKHMHDPEKYRRLYGEADEAAKAALAALGDKPDKEKAKEVKKLQEDIKASLKNA